MNENFCNCIGDGHGGPCAGCPVAFALQFRMDEPVIYYGYEPTKEILDPKAVRAMELLLKKQR